MLYDVILHTFFLQLLYTYTEREKDTKRCRLYYTHSLVGASASTIQPTWRSNIFPELLHLSGQMSQHCLCTMLLATARATLAFSPRSHRTPGIVFFLNEANGKSIFVLDILDQPLHIYTIPCICVLYKNHQVLESGHHHNVHGRHRRHIYDDKSTIIRRLSHWAQGKTTSCSCKNWLMGSFNTQIQHMEVLVATLQQPSSMQKCFTHYFFLVFEKGLRLKSARDI